VNIEADSINAAMLAPGSAVGSAACDAFLREVVREMTVKAGQKCTAIRRIFVPADQAGAIADALAAKLKSMKVGDPRQEDTRMGPLVTRSQQGAAFEGIRRLASEASILCGGPEPPRLAGIESEKSAFVAPTLLRVNDAADANAVHEVEVFGPAATIVPYRDEEEACALVARGGGSLVASVFAEDKEFLLRMVSAIGPAHGRILVVDPAIASAHTGHGIVMPQCNPGMPNPPPGVNTGNTVWCEVSLARSVVVIEQPLRITRAASLATIVLPRRIPCWSGNEKRTTSRPWSSIHLSARAAASNCSSFQSSCRSTKLRAVLSCDEDTQSVLQCRLAALACRPARRSLDP